MSFDHHPKPNLKQKSQKDRIRRHWMLRWKSWALTSVLSSKLRLLAVVALALENLPMLGGSQTAWCNLCLTCLIPACCWHLQLPSRQYLLPAMKCQLDSVTW
jgi:predicted anti-sigma-YlaC factor YlaD